MSTEFQGKKGKVRVMYVQENQSSGNSKFSKINKNKKRDNDFSFRDRPKNTYRSQNNRRRDNDEDPAFSPWGAQAKNASFDRYNDSQIDTRENEFAERIRMQRQEESRVYGENACLALFKQRSDSLISAWLLESSVSRFRDILYWMAANRKAYHIVDEEELEKVSSTKHHGGVCFLVKNRTQTTADEWLKVPRDKDCVLALENIGNPHNIGGIMRTCAHFGVKGIIIDDPTLLSSGAAIRTAEGGAEYVQAIKTEDFLASLEQFRQAGYQLVTTSSHKGTPLNKVVLNKKIVLVLGGEGKGLSDQVWKSGEMRIAISGTGMMESLNVSVAAGILLSKWWSQ